MKLVLTEVGVGYRWVVSGSIDSSVDGGQGGVGVGHGGSSGEGGRCDSMAGVGDGSGSSVA